MLYESGINGISGINGRTKEISKPYEKYFFTSTNISEHVYLQPFSTLLASSAHKICFITFPCVHTYSTYFCTFAHGFGDFAR